jgi:hypothetical protein
VVNLIIAAVVNLLLPLLIVLFFPGLFDSVWQSSMLIFPDIAWTALSIAIVLLVIGAVKTVLLIQYAGESKKGV